MTAPPEWLTQLANSVATLLHSPDALAPIGCHYQCVDDCWEITLFVSRTQLVGGPRDGEEICSRFVVDLERLRECFEKVNSFSWQALPMIAPDDFGAHIVVDGIFEDEPVRLRLLAIPPEQFEAGRIADVYEARLYDLW